MSEKHRKVYLIVYNSRLFPAHWALWIPSETTANIGKLINARGDALNGFKVVFERNYDISSITSTHEIITLGDVDEKYVVDTPGDGIQIEDQVPQDLLEEAALEIRAPDRSLVAASSGSRRHRVDIKNCQTWLQEFIAHLVKKEILNQACLVVLEQAPRN